MEVEEWGQDRVSSTRQKQTIKLKLAEELPTSEIGINDLIVKQEDHSRKQQKMTDILEGTQSDDILETTKIKSDLVECNNLVGLRDISLFGPRRYKRGMYLQRNTNKAGYEVQVSGYRFIQVLSILGQVPSCCVRKEEEKGNRTKGREASLI